METATAAEVPAPPEHQLLLTPGNVALTLDDLKTETRRLIRPQPVIRPLAGGGDDIDGVPMLGGSLPYKIRERFAMGYLGKGKKPKVRPRLCPYGKPGDILWVRETWQLIRAYDDGEVLEWQGKGPVEHPGGIWHVVYAADNHPEHFDDRGWHWRPNIFMPRWACRLRLRVEEIAIEQLHDITPAGARAEGMRSEDPVAEYAEQWNWLHPKAQWETTNPWVYVVRYSRCE